MGTWEIREASPAVDGGDGMASVTLPPEDLEVVEAMKLRTKSSPEADPLTGADLGKLGGPSR
jgi:Mn-containing catalase